MNNRVPRKKGNIVIVNEVKSSLNVSYIFSVIHVLYVQCAPCIILAALPPLSSLCQHSPTKSQTHPIMFKEKLHLFVKPAALHPSGVGVPLDGV